MAGSFAEGMTEGAGLFLRFKQSERQERLVEEQLATSKYNRELKQKEEKVRVDTAKVNSANELLQNTVNQYDQAVLAAGNDPAKLRAVDELFAPQILKVTDLYKGVEGDAAMRNGDRDYVGGKVGADGRVYPLMRNNDTGKVAPATEGGVPFAEGGKTYSFENMQQTISQVSSHGRELAAKMSVSWEPITNPAQQRTIDTANAAKDVKNVKTVLGIRDARTKMDAKKNTSKETLEALGRTKLGTGGKGDAQPLADGPVSSSGVTPVGRGGPDQAAAPVAEPAAAAAAVAPTKVTASGMSSSPESYTYDPAPVSRRKTRSARSSSIKPKSEELARSEIDHALKKADELDAQAAQGEDPRRSAQYTKQATNWRAIADQKAAKNFKPAGGESNSPMANPQGAIAEKSSSEQDAILRAAESRAKLSEQRVGRKPSVSGVREMDLDSTRQDAAGILAEAVDPRGMDAETTNALTELLASNAMTVPDIMKALSPVEDKGKWKTVEMDDGSSFMFKESGPGGGPASMRLIKEGAPSQVDIREERQVAHDVLQEAFKNSGIEQEWTGSLVSDIGRTNWPALGFDLADIGDPFFAQEVAGWASKAQKSDAESQKLWSAFKGFMGQGTLSTSIAAQVTASMTPGMTAQQIESGTANLMKGYKKDAAMMALPPGVWTNAVAHANAWDLSRDDVIQAYAAINAKVDGMDGATEKYKWSAVLKLLRTYEK
jgi:hypothetical protein